MLPRVIACLVVVGLVSSCVTSSSVTCEGYTCPLNEFCDAVHGGCVTQEQLAGCDAQPDFVACSYAGEPNGSCYDGVCLPGGCGNGRMDPTEACEDGNVVGGDGCSADCASTETCGNGVTDPFKGEICDDGDLDHLQHDGCSTCVLEQPAWLPGATFMVAARRGHGIVADTKRNVLVLFGGRTSVGFQSDTWEWDGLTWREVQPTRSPAARQGHMMAFDTARGVTVLFGGESATGRRNDTWEFDGVSWTEITVATPPPARHDGAMTYDATRARTVMHGGTGLIGTALMSFADTWTWDGATWTPHTQGGGPSARAYHAMAYDGARKNVVMFGGSSPTPADTWIWNGVTWSQPTVTTTPPTRAQTALAFDAARGRVVMFGGSSTKSDTYTWDGVNWTLSLAVAPTGLDAHAMAFDGIRNKVILFGGRSSSGFSQETREWDGAAWTTIPIGIATTPPTPTARYRHAMAHDDARGEIVMFGGQDSVTQYLADTWVWRGAWRRLTPAMAPSARVSHAMAYDERRKVVVLFGGLAAGVRSGETWEWNGITWTLVTTTNPPTARMRHVMTYDAARGVVVLFGGNAGTGLAAQMNDTWTWNGSSWTQLVTTDRPSGRTGAALAYDRARGMVVLSGGIISSTTDGETWELDGTNWIKRPGTLVRAFHSLAYDPNLRRTIAFGGNEAGAEPVADTWTWDGTAWTELPIASTPPPRNQQAMAIDPTRASLVMFGGSVNDEPILPSETWVFRYARSALDVLDERCRLNIDADDDGLSSCMDPDCWATCTPSCSPGQTCDPAAARCGDGTCNSALESSINCATDCPAPAWCGDFTCTSGETSGSCPGDC